MNRKMIDKRPHIQFALVGEDGYVIEFRSVAFPSESLAKKYYDKLMKEAKT